MFTHRTLSQHLSKVTSSFPVLLVTGPRQVGKTTLLQHSQEEKRIYVTLDDPLLRALAKEDPALFLQNFPPPILIDEIQYAPELLPFIKMDVDKHHQPNSYWLTGSQQFHLMKNVSESLAGRVGILKLQGLSQAEKLGKKVTPPFLPSTISLETPFSLDSTSLYQLIWRGSFPAIALDPTINHNVFYSSYVQTYLERDVRDLTHVNNYLSFVRFLRTVAARTAQLINFSDLARDADISVPTAKAWLSILQASGLVFLLEPYFANITKRMVKTPKLYFLDTGLCAYLTNWTTPETLSVGAMSGAIFETYVISELLKSYWHNAQEASFFFYRDKNNNEIDLLIQRDGIIYPIEIKRTAKPTKQAMNMNALKTLPLPVGPGALICLVDKLIPLSASIQAVPVGYL